MAFPSHKPTARAFSGGDWPQKKYVAQSGEETRILYGDKKTGLTMKLSYNNIADTKADDFFVHYDAMKGTYKTFSVPAEVRDGWSGTASYLKAGTYNNKWRFSGPPQVTQVKKGVSNISVTLISVL
tara:strand:- start:2645 stop:3022 length:378 start_codon:yes stop_codon:yes gene_type:complete